MSAPAQQLANPFTPSFGEVPPHLAGRSLMLADFSRAFKAPKRHPLQSTAITGARGTGKTALLSLAALEAEAHGWIAVRTVAMPGMLDDILIAGQRAASHLAEDPGRIRLAGLSVAGFGSVSIERSEIPTNWRNEMTDLLEQLEKTNTGLLIAVDEVRPALDDMIRLAATYQLFVTEGRKIALLMAGLPHNILRLEKDKTVSFLRRAQRIRLGSIPDFEIKSAMRQTIEDGGRTVAPEALDAAVAASEGFPFMMQLVGFRMWDRQPDHPVISPEDAEAGIALAREELRERIVAVTYDGLSKGDQAFLAVLAASAEQMTVAEVARALGKSHSYATQYKNRLLGQGVIAAAANGTLRFDLPLMREYVLEATRA